MLLSLLLCLTVPIAGGASVLGFDSGSQPHRHTNVEATHHHHHHGQDQSVAACAHDHSGLHHAHRKPCKGDHCGCGCGTGACTAPVLSVVPDAGIILLALGPDPVVAFSNLPLRIPARHASPLRPPISLV